MCSYSLDSVGFRFHVKGFIAPRDLWRFLRPPRRFCDVAGLAYFFVVDDADDLVFADFGLAGGGGGVVVLHGEFHALGGEQAPGFLPFATPIDVHARDAALFRHDLVVPAEGGDAGDDGLVGGGVKRGRIRKNIEHFTDAEVVAAAHFDIREILADGREMGGFGTLQIAVFFLHERLRIDNRLRSIADGADAADEVIDAIGIPARQARKLGRRFFAEVLCPLEEIFWAVRNDVVIWHVSGVSWCLQREWPGSLNGIGCSLGRTEGS